MLLLFMDFETNGLVDLRTLPPRLIEAAWLVAEPGASVPLARGHAFVAAPAAGTARGDESEAMAMHEASGLADAWGAGPRVTVEALDGRLADLLVDVAAGRGVEPDERGFVAVMAGAGVAAFDRPLLRAWMPRTDRLVHYRPADTSVVRTSLGLMGALLPGEPEQAGTAHRAADDVETAWRRWLALAEWAGKGNGCLEG